jgi:hypothetical protein
MKSSHSRTILAASAALLLSMFATAAAQEAAPPAKERPAGYGAPGGLSIPGGPSIGPGGLSIPGGPAIPGAASGHSLTSEPSIGAVGPSVSSGTSVTPERKKPAPGRPPMAGAFPGASGPPVFTAALDAGNQHARPRTGQDIIREAKLKVLQKHYEETLSETIRLERTALSAEPEERAKMEATAKAMRDFLAKLEADLGALAPPPAKTSAAPLQTHPVIHPSGSSSEIDVLGGDPPVIGASGTPTVPGLESLGSGGGASLHELSPDGSLVASARAELDKIKALETLGQAPKLDIIKAETRLKWAEATAVGDRAGAARAMRDGLRQRLEVVRSFVPSGAATPAEVAEIERELRMAEADLQLQKAAHGHDDFGIPGAAPAPALGR